jgi:hypothetical protein
MAIIVGSIFSVEGLATEEDDWLYRMLTWYGFIVSNIVGAGTGWFFPFLLTLYRLGVYVYIYIGCIQLDLGQLAKRWCVGSVME